MSDLLIPTRRGFLAGVAALFAAPAIVKIENLMPLWIEPPELWDSMLFYNIGWDRLELYQRRIFADGSIKAISSQLYPPQVISRVDYSKIPHTVTADFKEAIKLPPITDLNNFQRALAKREPIGVAGLPQIYMERGHATGDTGSDRLAGTGASGEG